MNPVCKLGSSDPDFSDTESLVSHFSVPCLVSAPPSTSSHKMNICSTSVSIAPHVAVLQVMNSDAALYSVAIPETVIVNLTSIFLAIWKDETVPLK